MNKLKLINDLLNQKQADAFLFKNDMNRLWLSDFDSSFGFTVVAEDKITLFLDGRYFEKAKKEIKNKKIKVVRFKSMVQVFDFMKSKNLENILVEAETFTLAESLVYQEHFRTIVPCKTQELRMTKEKYEVSRLSKAAKIVCQAMEWIQENIEIGMTEKQVAAMVTAKMMELGATKNSFDPIVASGRNGAYPHHKPTTKKIKDNEFVTIDMGCIYRGYCSDLTRTFPIGTPNKKLIEAYKVVLASNKAGLEACRTGMVGSDLDQVCRKVIDKSPFKKFFPHSTGHGVGIEVHELPNVAPSYKGTLPLDSIVTIEPGIYIPGVGGIRIEDTVLVKDKTSKVLTSSASKWLEE